ncbi:MAG TPA: PqqD family protein [Anaerolineae bacterium]|nr:PqqD family protein [Anaerolineae bacterium]HQI86907.1 PqqD family protein [Anaerolineae bacterium]
MLNWDDVLTKAPAIVTRESGDELVVVLPEQGKFVVLNATGARMLRLTDGIRTLREIARAIALEFNADPAQVESDVLRFAQSLVERGALTVIKRHG